MEVFKRFRRTYGVNIFQHYYRLLKWNSDWNKLNFLAEVKDYQQDSLDLAEEKIFTFWTGNNPMSKNRKKCLSMMREICGVDIILITPENLYDYILKEHPLSKFYDCLSLVHKSDYLRSYFMYYYGGGYSDIKTPTNSWRGAFSLLNSNSKKTGLGYQEVKNGAAFIKENSKISIKDVYNLNYKLQTGYKKLIGNGAYIFKPKSIIFRKLLEEK